jgi:hemerythrin-like domain-containing protein
MASVVAARTASHQSSRTSSNGSASRRRRTSQAHGDAIALLKADHRTVEKLFRDFERSGETAYRTRRKLVDKMITELSVHAAVEEQFLYPAARREVPNLESEVLEAMEEHHVAKWLLSELERTDPKDERFTAKVNVPIENVRHHVREEESELCPVLRSTMGRSRLREPGDQLGQGKRLAPTHPHPRSSDTPPANLIAGAVTGAFDRARDKVTARSR